MEFHVGDIINSRYRLVSERGRGTFGEVWQAWDEILDMEVAIKIYIALDNRGIDEFKSEYRTTFSLTHPNLLHASHFDVVEKRPYLVMPYCPESADELVGKISEEEAWRFIRDVSSGLAYLHSKNIIHRDIKPDNILRDGEGNFLISDFGVSVKMRSTLRKNSVRDLSESTTQGTIGYMGPEMFTANPSAVKATDIWALGATVFEMLEEEMPFFGQGGVMLLHGGEIPDLKGSWSDSLKSTVAACLSKETWERPKAEDLEWYASGFVDGHPSVLPWETAWRKRKEDDERKRQEAEQKRIEEERLAEEARQRAIEEERKKVEAEKRRQEEEASKAAEAERKRQEEEERRQEEELKKVEAEKRRQEEEARKAAEAERKKQEKEENARLKAAAKELAKAEKAEKKEGQKSGKEWLWIAAVAAAAGVFIWSPWNDNGPQPEQDFGVKQEEPITVDSTPDDIRENEVQAESGDVAKPEPVKKEPVSVSGVTLSKSDLSIEEGQGVQLLATIHPVGADNKSVSWKSNDPSVATVSSKGYVSAKKAGSATITVTSADGGKTATCMVSVNEKAPVIVPVNQQPQPKTNDWTEVKKRADSGDAKACYDYAKHCYDAGKVSNNGSEKIRLFKIAYKYAGDAIRLGETRAIELDRILRENEQIDKI